MGELLCIFFLLLSRESLEANDECHFATNLEPRLSQLGILLEKDILFAISSCYR